MMPKSSDILFFAFDKNVTILEFYGIVGRVHVLHVESSSFTHSNLLINNINLENAWDPIVAYVIQWLAKAIISELSIFFLD